MSCGWRGRSHRRPVSQLTSVSAAVTVGGYLPRARSQLARVPPVGRESDVAKQPTEDEGRRPEITGSVVELLDEAECLRLISAGVVGRIGYTGRFGPTVLPVNYVLYEGTIVFRTGQHS